MRVLLAWIFAMGFSVPVLSAELTVVVKDVKGTKGEIVVRLYRSAEGFPSDPTKAAAEATSAIAGTTFTLSFASVQAGRYSLIAIHDENGDGVMEKTFLGLPEEGYGLSTNPRPLLVPRFSDGLFEIKDGSNEIEVALVYY